MNSIFVEMKLSETEEILMNHLWMAGKAFMKDLIEVYPEPKPATTTIATLLKRMIDKGFVGYKEYGNSREYYPLVEKTDYFSTHIDGLVKKFFNNSFSQFASLFTSNDKINEAELEELRKIIDSQLKQKQQ